MLKIGIRFLVLAVAGLGASAPAPRRVSARPKPTDELLANPGMGWQTFHTFADEDRNLQGLPSSCAYARFYWREIETSEGKIAFPQLDGILQHAKRAGQQFAFRIMCTGSEQYLDAPSWLKAQGCKGTEFLYGGAKHWVPDFEDPLFRKAHFRLIRALGKRYDGDPRLAVVDLGSVGLWGEWHMSDTRDLASGQPVPLPPPATRRAIIDAWRAAFPKTPKVMLIGDTEGMRYATQDGCGWRADCMGDLGGFSKNWNHMQNLYPQQIAASGAGNAWKQAPVAFESCWDMRKWQQEGWNIRSIFDYALNLHASYLNNKSAPIPEGTRPEVERFLRRLGYRLVLELLDYDASVTPGDRFQLDTTWENTGVAPPYGDYRLAIRLTPAGRAQPLTLVSATSIRGWLPGPRQSRDSFALPRALQPGRYRLALGVVEPSTKQPRVRLAIADRAPDGWYPVGEVQIAAR